mmetsp:Transcript_104681/g.332970  ORF Transcript_104681/g.332970 Transcript_104681/m.332970 type:complete len:308 (-) Transcript_104681:65-988(-)
MPATPRVPPPEAMASKAVSPHENPLEATFFLLKGLRDELQELRDELAEEKKARTGENKIIAAQVKELKGTELQHHSEVLAMIEELRAAKLSRFEQFESFVDQALSEKATRFQKLETKLEAEITERKGMVQALNKRLGAEAQQMKVRAEKHERDVKEHKRTAELASSGHRQRHDELRQEVERIAGLLRENSMARDPFRHFPQRMAGEFGTPLPGANPHAPGFSRSCTSPHVGGSRPSTHAGGSRPPTSLANPVESMRDLLLASGGNGLYTPREATAEQVEAMRGSDTQITRDTTQELHLPGIPVGQTN